MLILCVCMLRNKLRSMGTCTAHTLSVRSFLQNMAEEEMAHHVVGNDSGTSNAGFAGDDVIPLCSLRLWTDPTCQASQKSKWSGLTDRQSASSFLFQGNRGASPFFVGGVICLVSSVSVCTEKEKEEKKMMRRDRG